MLALKKIKVYYAHYKHGYLSICLLLGIKIEEEIRMKENVGTVDRTLRVVFGIALLFAGWLGSLGIVGIVIGAVLVFTGAFSFCPIYSALGKNTVEGPDPRGH